MIGIYKITNLINGKIYIGQSVKIKNRWQQHKQEVKSNRTNTLLYNAMRKYGLDNFSFEVIEECDKDQLNEREIYWISYYDSFNKEKGYNMTPGGSEPIKINPQEIYDLWDQGYCVSDIAEKLKDKVGHTTIQNYLNDYSNYSPQESNRRGGLKAYKKAVESGNFINTLNSNNTRKLDDKINQYDLWGNYIATYSSQAEIERKTGIDAETIGWVLNGKRQQAGGYQWLLNDNKPVDLTKQKGFRFKFGIIQYDLNNNEIARYLSITEAAKAMGCDSKNIARVCKHENNRTTACGYKWEYDYSIWDYKPIFKED